jgi:hypothetical protein
MRLPKATAAMERTAMPTPGIAVPLIICAFLARAQDKFPA